jgi:putative phosphoesterase
MKIAFISDIHGNAVALNAVLQDIDSKQVDQVVILGDLIFRGPEPRLVIDRLRSPNMQVIKGNTDEWIVCGIKKGEVSDQEFEIMNVERDWTAMQLSKDDLDYLQRLQHEIHINLTDEILIHAFHATPINLFDIVLPDAGLDVMSSKIMMNKQASIYVYAHNHLPFVRFIAGKCIINTGGVGYTFDGVTKPSYAIVEAIGNQYRVSLERINYDIEVAVERYYSVNYPNAKLMSHVIREAVHPSLVGFSPGIV